MAAKSKSGYNVVPTTSVNTAGTYNAKRIHTNTNNTTVTNSTYSTYLAITAGTAVTKGKHSPNNDFESICQ
jgi:hypothetical protein